jgi:hypothetical protein
MQSLKLDEIATELFNTDDRDVHAPPNIKYWLHRIKLGRTDLQTQHVGGRPHLDDVDAEIISVLLKLPFSSVRTTADSLNIHASRIYTHLAEKIGLDIFPLLVSPHINQWAAAKASRTYRAVTPRAWTTTGRLPWYRDQWGVMVSATWWASANMVSIGRRDPDKIGAYDNGPENHAHRVPKHPRRDFHWLAPTRGKAQQRILLWKILESLSQDLHRRRGVGSSRPIMYFDNAAPHRSGANENYVQSCQLRQAPWLTVALISVPVTFSIRWSEDETQSWRIGENGKAAR